MSQQQQQPQESQRTIDDEDLMLSNQAQHASARIAPPPPPSSSSDDVSTYSLSSIDSICYISSSSSSSESSLSSSSSDEDDFSSHITLERRKGGRVVSPGLSNSNAKTKNEGQQQPLTAGSPIKKTKKKEKGNQKSTTSPKKIKKKKKKKSKETLRPYIQPYIPPPSSSSSSSGKHIDTESKKWLSRVQSYTFRHDDLRDAPENIKRDKSIVMLAVQNSGRALEYASSDLRNDIQVVMAAVQGKDGHGMLRYASPNLRSNRRVVLLAVHSWGENLEYASSDLQNDEEVVMVAVRRGGECGNQCLRYASPYLRSNKRVVMEAVIFYGPQLAYASPDLQNDMQFVMTAIRRSASNSGVLRFASPSLRNNKEVVMVAVQRRWDNLQYASPTLRNNKEIVLSALQAQKQVKHHRPMPCFNICGGCALRYASPDLQNNKGLVIEAVSRHVSALAFASRTFQNDVQAVHAAVLNDGLALHCASPKLQGDVQLVQVAVRNNGFALQYASPELQNDLRLVQVAVRNNGLALQYASADLRRNKQLVMEAVQTDGSALRYSPELQDDLDVVVAAVWDDDTAIQYASLRLQRDNAVVYKSWESKVQNPGDIHELLGIFRGVGAPNFILNDKKIMLAAIQNISGNILEYAPIELRNDKQLVIAAVQKSSSSLQFASPESKGNIDIVTAAIKQNGTALQHASPDLQNDINTVMTAIRKPGPIPSPNFDKPCSVLKYASPKLQNNKKVVMEAVNRDGRSLQYASPSLQKDKEVVKAATQQNPWSFTFASPELRNDKDFVLQVIKLHVAAFEYASPQLQNDDDVNAVVCPYWLAKVKKAGFLLGDAPESIRSNKRVVMAAVQKFGWALQYACPELQKDKEIAVAAVTADPDAIKYVHGDYVGEDSLKADPEVLLAAGQFDIDHCDKQQRTKKRTRKIVFSTRFSFLKGSYSEATNFVALFSDHRYIRKSNFHVYAPNTNNKQTCDDNWTDYDCPCRGTEDTCRYKNVLTDDGRPTDDCCWRYSFRNQLQEAKESQGFMIQLVESEDPFDTRKAQILGNGQRIELDMAQNYLKMKTFQVRRPMSSNGVEHRFTVNHIEKVITAIEKWYDGGCEDLKICKVEYGSEDVGRIDKNTLLDIVSNQNPEYIMYAGECELRRDRDILIAAGLLDEEYDTLQIPAKKKKIFFSTRYYSLTVNSGSQGTRFTKLLKQDEYIRSNFVSHAPNAFSLKTCDPDWTRFDYPCRGTNDTCQYNNILSETGRPTDDCCWRYSGHFHLDEAKGTGGFMAQLIESGEELGAAENAKLSNGQKIDLDIAQQLGIKIFQVYRPTKENGYEGNLEQRHIGQVVDSIKAWYDEACRDMSECVIRPTP